MQTPKPALETVNLLAPDEITRERARGALEQSRRWVVKVGSSLVTNEGRGLDERAIGEWCRQMASLTQPLPGSGQVSLEIIMVSSGAVAEGMKRWGWSTRPSAINE